MFYQANRQTQTFPVPRKIKAIHWAGNSWSLNFLIDKIWKIINSFGKTDDFIKNDKFT